MTPPRPQGQPILPLKVRDLVFEAGGKTLVKNVSFTLDDGGCSVILGPNGAGKSLLLRLCHGLLRPKSGEIRWEGANGRDPRPLQSMVFQRPMMLRRSVLANAEYPLKLRRVPKDERRERAMEMLARVGLRRLADFPARRLSGGEQQLLSLARAWLTGPRVMFLDEPTANLDPAATHAIEDVIADVKASGAKVVMTTHDLGQARRLADEALFMHRGRLLEQGPAEAFFSQTRNEKARAFLQGELLWWRRRELTPDGGVEKLLHPETTREP